jgi:hypothetical protein
MAKKAALSRKVRELDSQKVAGKEGGSFLSTIEFPIKSVEYIIIHESLIIVNLLLVIKMGLHLKKKSRDDIE